LTSSAAAIVFAYLPFILVDMVEASILWRVLSAVLATWITGIVIFRVRQVGAANLSEIKSVRNPYVVAATIFFAVILVVNALWFASSSLYLAGMLWLMMVPFLTFVGLLLSSWQPLSHETPPADDQVIWGGLNTLFPNFDFDQQIVSRYLLARYG
jgi:fatty acid desaturase